MASTFIISTNPATVYSFAMGLIGRKAQQKKHQQQELAAERIFATQIDGHVLGLSTSGDATIAVTGEGALVRIDAKGIVNTRSEVHPNGALSYCDAHGRIVVGGMDGSIVLIEADQSVQRVPLQKNGWVEHVVVSSAGTIAAAIGRNVFVLGKANAVCETLTHNSSVAAITFSEDGSQLAVARNGGVDLHTLGNPKNPSTRRELPWKSSIISVAMSPNGAYIVGGCQDEALHFWRLATQEDSMMNGYASKPKCIAFGQDGAWLVSSGGRELVLWRFHGAGPEGTEPLVLDGHSATINSIAVSQNGEFRVVSGARDASLCFWRPNKQKTPIFRAQLGASVQVCALSENGFLAGTSEGMVARFVLAAH